MNKRVTIKIIYTVCLSLATFSCADRAHEINQLNQRITHLEQKIDSLAGIRHTNSIESNTINYPGSNLYTIPYQNGHCQAITKKGTQCKRKAKGNGYCWQHAK